VGTRLRVPGVAAVVPMSLDAFEIAPGRRMRRSGRVRYPIGPSGIRRLR
jgi:hypothetical protein